MSKKRFTIKQKGFINAYILCLNATEAARRAGYKGDYGTLRAIGSENLTKPNIRAEIDRIFNKTTMSAGEVLARLTAQARGDLYDVLDPATNTVDWKHASDLGITHLIHTAKQRTVISVSKDGEESETHTLEVKLYSSQEALKVLAKYHVLLTDRLEIHDWRMQLLQDIQSGNIKLPDVIAAFGGQDDLVSAIDEPSLATRLFAAAGYQLQDAESPASLDDDHGIAG